MQVLKDSVREAILKEAEKLLLAHGYEGTTMRMIASAINMSVSNLYKYFADKQSIYKELVNAFHYRFLENFDHFLNEENEGNYTDENIRYVSSSFSKKLTEHRNVFLILMENSHHSDCLPFKQQLYRRMAFHLIEGSDQDCGYEPFIIEILVQSIWDGIQSIIKNSREPHIIEDRLYHLLKYHFMGLSLFHDKE